MAGPSILVKVGTDMTGLKQGMSETGTQAQSASSRIHGAFSSVLDQLNSTGVLGPFGTALSTANDSLGKLGDKMGTVGTKMMAIGGIGLGVGLALQQMGSKEQAAQQQLSAAIDATGHSYDDYAKQIDAAVKQQEKYGNSAADTKGALQVLTQATHDPQKALELLGTASDLAAAKHESLGAAAGQLGKTYNGSARLLKEFGDQTDATGAKVKGGAEAMDMLSKQLSGQASASADTFSGKMRGLKASVEDAVSTFAQKYGPAITTAGAAMTGLGAALEIGKAAQAAFASESALATAAQWAFNLAMSANPIMIVVLALAALVAAVVLAYQHVTWFRDGVNDMGHWVVVAFDTVRDAAEAVFKWLESNWPLVLAILTGPFGIAVYLIATYWNTIVEFARQIPGRILAALSGFGDMLYGAGRDIINGLARGISDGVGAVTGFVGGIAHSILTALGNVGDILYNAGKSIIDGLGRGIEDSLKAVLGTVGGIAGKIASLKGPLDYDRKLLVPAGTAIMQGLNDSIAAGMDNLTTTLGEVTSVIAVTPITPPTSTPTANNTSPAVNIEHATFTDGVDVDTLLQKAAAAQTVGRL